MSILHNSELKVIVSGQGAEVKSVQSLRKGFEFVWPGKDIWNRSAPVLFPIVGKVKDDRLLIDGKAYKMGQHGFARDREFRLLEESAQDCTYVLEVRPDEQYPYSMDLYISYELEGNRLRTTYQVDNKGVEKTWFSVGAHPAFCLPVQDLSRYYIEFSDREEIERYLLQNGFLSGQKVKLSMDGTKLLLNSDLLLQDALVFKHLRSKRLALKQFDSPFCIQLDFEGFPYLGIWTKPGTQQFLCLEPWCGIADGIEGHSSIQEKEGMIVLNPGEGFERSFDLSFHK